MSTLKDHFTYVSLLLRHLSLMTSSSLGPKIYLRGAIQHTLIYGGLGHRPLLSEELMIVGSSWIYFAILVLYGKSLTFGLHLIFLQVWVIMYHLHSLISLNLSQNTLTYANLLSMHKLKNKICIKTCFENMGVDGRGTTSIPARYYRSHGTTGWFMRGTTARAVLPATFGPVVPVTRAT